MAPRLLGRLAFIGTLALGACVPSADDDDDATVQDDDDAVSDDDDDSTPEETDYASLTGTVVDPSGAPLAELRMTMCGQFCVFASSDADGVFFFERAPAGAAVLENLFAPGEEEADWSKFFDIVTVPEGEHVVLEVPVVVPQVAGTVLDLTGTQEIELDGGLTIAFDADAVEPPLVFETVGLGGVELPPDRFPTGGLGDWTVLRGWSLVVWDMVAKDGFAATAPLLEALPADTEVAFLVADYNHGVETGELVVEDAELSADGLTISTPTVGGLDRTTLVLAAARLD